MGSHQEERGLGQANPEDKFPLPESHDSKLGYDVHVAMLQKPSGLQNYPFDK
jgi:hypothetical protein